MITTRLSAAVAAGAIVIGILVGSAGTIVLRDTTTPTTADWSTHMSQMGSMMSMMAGQGGMMNGQATSGPGMMGPTASAMPAGTDDHHPTTSPEPTR